MKSSNGWTPEIPYRADIDGLRAIAVLSVIGFHASPSLIPGGFVGVDVFFVISGFLISSLILKGLESKSFSYVEFYWRRIRRLFPALIVVLLATLILGWFALSPFEYASLGRITVAGAAFVANIQIYSEVGYFDAPAASKPLLHLWSLGVEEQFYFIFPALLVLAWRYRLLTLSFALLGITSFALNIALVRSYPAFTFYLPVTRFWEFVAGGLLAFSNSSDRAPSIFGLFTLLRRNIFAAIGVFLILAGVCFTSEEAFPGWWGLLPVIGSFCLIGAGPQAWINRKVLAIPGLVFIGLISYPLYLWHWPLLVMGRTIMSGYDNEHVRTTTIIAVVLAFVLSWLTYKFIERPIRARRPIIITRRIVTACFSTMVVVALLGLVIVQRDGLPSRYPDEAQALMIPTPVFADFPPVDESKNSAGPLLVTYGDSHSEHLLAGLRRLQNERTFRLHSIYWKNCAPIGHAKPGDDETCRKLTAANESAFEKLRPDIVVIAGFWYSYRHVDKLRETLQYFQRIGVPRIVVMGGVPYWPRSPQLMLYRAYAADPLHRIPDRLFGFATQTLEIDRQVKEIASSIGVYFISAFDIFCDENGCLARVGNSAKDIVQVDRGHLSAAGSWFLISHVAQQILN
jgi:peptidoglycan/LPS O-acetylase OafA/YrhL